ncbi:hypothetical protein AAMO2058_000512900 [Amorphochlora amoebiformis]
MTDRQLFEDSDEGEPEEVFGVYDSRKLYKHITVKGYDLVEFSKLLKVANCNWRSRELRETVLIKTARMGFFELTKILLDEHKQENTLKKQQEDSFNYRADMKLHADLTIRDRHGNDAIMHAAESGFLCILMLLNNEMSTIDPSIVRKVDQALLVKSNKNANVLMAAAANGHMHILWYIYCKMPKYPVDEVDNQGRTALTMAIAGGHLRCVEFLVDVFKVRVKWIDNNTGWTPIHYAFYHQEDDILRFLVMRLIELEYPKIKHQERNEAKVKHAIDDEVVRYDYRNDNTIIGLKDNNGRRLHYKIDIVSHLMREKNYISVKPTFDDKDVPQATVRMNSVLYNAIDEAVQAKRIYRGAIDVPTLLAASCGDIYNSWGSLVMLRVYYKNYRISLEQKLDCTEAKLREDEDIQDKDLEQKLDALYKKLDDVDQLERFSNAVMRFIRLGVVATCREPNHQALDSVLQQTGNKFEDKSHKRRTSTYGMYMNGLYRSGLAAENIPIEKGDVIEMFADFNHERKIQYRFATIMRCLPPVAGQPVAFVVRLNPTSRFNFKVIMSRKFNLVQVSKNFHNKLSALLQVPPISMTIKVVATAAMATSMRSGKLPGYQIYVEHQTIRKSTKKVYQELVDIYKDDRDFLEMFFEAHMITFDKMGEPQILQPSEDFRVLRSHIQPLHLTIDEKGWKAPHFKDAREFATQRLLDLPEVKSLLQLALSNYHCRRITYSKYDEDTTLTCLKCAITMAHEEHLERDRKDLQKTINEAETRHTSRLSIATLTANFAVANWRLSKGLMVYKNRQNRLKYRSAAKESFSKAVKLFSSLSEEKTYQKNEEFQIQYYNLMNMYTSFLGEDRNRHRKNTSRSSFGNGSPALSRSSSSYTMSFEQIQLDMARADRKMFYMCSNPEKAAKRFKKVRDYLPAFRRKKEYDVFHVGVTPAMLVAGVLSQLEVEETVKGLDIFGCADKLCHDMNNIKKKKARMKDTRSRRLKSMDSTSVTEKKTSADSKEERLREYLGGQILDFSTVVDRLKDPQAFADDTLESLENFIFEQRTRELIQDIIMLGRTEKDGDEREFKALLITQTLVDTVQYIARIHRKVSTMWKNWLVVHLTKFLKVEDKSVGQSRSDTQARQDNIKIEKSLRTLLAEQWSEDFKAKMVKYLVDETSAEISRLQPNVAQQRQSVFARRLVSTASDTQVEEDDKKQFVDYVSKPQYEGTLYMICSIFKILKSNPVTTMEDGTDLRQELRAHYESAMTKLKAERAKLEMSWLEDRLELSQSLLEHVKHHQRLALTQADARDRQASMLKAIDALFQSYKLSPLSEKSLEGLRAIYTTIKGYKDFSGLLIDRPFLRQPVDFPEWVDRSTLDETYDIEESRVSGRFKEYRAMKLWSNLEVLDWAIDKGLPKSNRDVVDVLRNKMRDHKMKKDRHITGVDLMKLTVNLKRSDKALEADNDLSWRSLLYYQRDVEKIEYLVREQLQKEVDDIDNREKILLMRKSHEFDLARRLRIKSRANSGQTPQPCFPVFSRCLGVRPGLNHETSIDFSNFDFGKLDEDQVVCYCCVCVVSRGCE